MKKIKPKILFLDIECSYNIASTWTKWTPSMRVIKEKSVICIAYKFLGDKTTKIISISDDPKLFNKDPFIDKGVIEAFIPILEKADAIVAHNLDKYDIKMLNTRALKNGLILPMVKQVDTLKIAKKYFSFYSNRLGDLADFLDVDRKSSNSISWWDNVLLNKDITAMEKINKYCKKDVEVLEQIYKKLIVKHKTPVPLSDIFYICPHCDGQHVQSRGVMRTLTKIYKRFQCQECFHWFKANDKGKIV